MLISDRSDLRPLHHPEPRLRVAASSLHFMVLPVWHQLKSGGACSVIRAD